LETSKKTRLGSKEPNQGQGRKKITSNQLREIATTKLPEFEHHQY